MIHFSELLILLTVYSASSILVVLVLQMSYLKLCRKIEIFSSKAVVGYLSTVAIGTLGTGLVFQFAQIPALGPIWANPSNTGIPIFFPAAFISTLLGAIVVLYLGTPRD